MSEKPGAVIETTRLSRTYGNIRAVVDLDLTVERGQIFGFLGPNGAGKTTTIRMLLGLQRPTSGTAQVLGADCVGPLPEMHRRVGYLPGDLALYPRITGARLLQWFAHARAITDLAQAHTLVERFDMVMDRPVRQLSKGNRQKLGLLLAFMHRPELLILDEPTSGLDPLMQNQFEQLLRESVAAGATVFLSSHDLDEVQRLADRVAIIRAGRLVTSGTVADLQRNTSHRIEARLAAAADPAPFVDLPGVSSATAAGMTLHLEVTGSLGPVLTRLGALEPVDVVCRHADLDELFLDIYRAPDPAENPDAH